MVHGLTRRSFAQTLLAAAAPAIAARQDPAEFFGVERPEKLGIRPGVSAELKAYLQQQIDARVIPGAKVAATRRGKLFLEMYLGTYCDRKRRDNPVTADTVQPLFSVSKMVSATAVVIAWQDGLIDIDAPAAEYVPEFANQGKGKITIRQLLSHSAGIPKMPGIPGDTEEHWKESVAKVCEMSLQWAPGSQTQYHANTGMLISAEAVRRRSGRKTWNQICRERIFQPLGLDSFSFDTPADSALVLISPPEDISIGAAHYRGSTGLPAGGCTGNITDLLKFLNFQTNQGVWKGKRLLQGKYWTAMHTVQYPGKPIPRAKAPGYDPWGLGMLMRGTGPGAGGLGWFGIRDQTSPTVFSHVGTSCAMAVGDPAADLEIAFFTTDVPKTKEKATEMRNTVTNKIFGAIVA